MKLIIVNGPNLNLLGKREPSVYGSDTFEDMFARMQQYFSEIELKTVQSNVEGELINFLHKADGIYNGIILNAGAYTHTSVALGDAVKGIATPVVEVHLSNIFSREDFRHVSYIAPYCAGSIMGFGADSYWLAVSWFVKNKS